MKSKYLLMPQWSFMNNGEMDFDIPPFFMKLFSSKKEIEEYLSKNNIKRKLIEIKNDAFAKQIKQMNLPPEEQYKELLKLIKDYQLTFWVITINPIDKENRIGAMFETFDKDKKPIWKYASFSGGRVWKDQLIFGTYR